MNLEIISIHNNGDQNKEYVLMKVLQNCDAGHYILADSTYTDDGKISNKVRHTYWIPDKEVEKGDLISIWTKDGKNTTSKTDSGTPIHRFFWGLNKPVWNDEGDCAVLFEVNTWQIFSVSD
ncbi:MAG: hypothetical protein WD607_02105 [Candidatus Paceibacterota bacterium]